MRAQTDKHHVTIGIRATIGPLHHVALSVLDRWSATGFYPDSAEPADRPFEGCWWQLYSTFGAPCSETWYIEYVDFVQMDVHPTATATHIHTP